MRVPNTEIRGVYTPGSASLPISNFDPDRLHSPAFDVNLGLTQQHIGFQLPIVVLDETDQLDPDASVL